MFSFASGKQLSACLSGGGASGGGDYTAGGAGSSSSGSGTCVSTGPGPGGALRGSGRCKAYIYVMHVAEELPAWPESKDRQRVWVSGHGFEDIGESRVWDALPWYGRARGTRVRGGGAPGGCLPGAMRGGYPEYGT